MPRTERFSWKWIAPPALALLMIGGAISFVDSLRPAVLRADAPDKEAEVVGFRLDVFVLVGTNLLNPIGFCTVEPCDPGETPPSSALFNNSGTSLDVTWGD